MSARAHMNVYELIAALSKIRDKTLPVIYDGEEESHPVQRVEIRESAQWWDAESEAPVFKSGRAVVL